MDHAQNTAHLSPITAFGSEYWSWPFSATHVYSVNNRFDSITELFGGKRKVRSWSRHHSVELAPNFRIAKETLQGELRLASLVGAFNGQKRASALYGA